VFRDDIVVRASAEPLNSVILDSVESGRVEEVFAATAAVKKGTCCSGCRTRSATWSCWRARPSTRAADLQPGQPARGAGSVRTDHQRRLSDLEFALAQARKQHARNKRLARRASSPRWRWKSQATNWRSRSARWTGKARRRHRRTGARPRAGPAGQRDHGLQSGLQLVSATVDALAVRAPATAC
jgi:HlyD family secretion protein